MQNHNEQKNSEKKLTGIRKAIPIILAALAIFIAVCLFTSGSGVLGKIIGKTLLGLFSYGAAAIPLMLLVHSFAFSTDVRDNSLTKRVVFSLTALISFSAIESVVYYWSASPVFNPTDAYVTATAGGFVGNAVGFVLSTLLGSIGAVIFIAAYLAIYSSFFFADKLGSFGRTVLHIGEAVKSILGRAKGAIDKKIENERLIKKQMEDEEHIRRSNDLMDDSFFNGNAGVDNLKIDDGTSAAKNEKTPDPTPEKKPRKKHRDKPVKIEFNLERHEPEKDVEESAPEAPASEEPVIPEAPKAKDDSADSIFTKDFDPLNFATEQRHAAKIQAKAPVKEELDELKIPEKPKSSALDDEKRAAFEKRRRMLLNMQRGNSSVDGAAPEVTPLVTSVNTQTAPALTDNKTSSPESASPVFDNPYKGFENAPEKTSRDGYSATHTTYTQPIKSVEFTITADPKRNDNAAAPTSPIGGYQTAPESPEESAEDVAKAISAKIARNTPGYARSANELKTYTTEIDRASETGSTTDIYTEDIPYATSSEDTLSANPDGASTFGEDAIYVSPESDSSDVFEFSTDPSSEDIADKNGEDADSVNEIILSDNDESDIPLDKADGNSPYDESFLDVDLTEDRSSPDTTSEVTVENENIEPTVPEGVEPEESSVAKNPYERAAAFAAELNDFTVKREPEPVENNLPVFKDFEAPSPEATEEVGTNDNTLKIERSMLSPTPAPIITEGAVSATLTGGVADATVKAQTVGAAIVLGADAGDVTYSKDRDEKATDTSVGSSSDNEDTPYTILGEDAFFSDERNEKPITETPDTEQALGWHSDEDAGEKPEESISDEDASAVFVDDDAEGEEDSDGEEEIISEMPEEENLPFEEIPPEEQNPEVAALRAMFPCLNPIGEIPEAKKEETPTAPIEKEAEVISEADAAQTEAPKEEPVDLSNYINEDLPPFDNPTLKREAPKPALAVQPFKEEKKKADFSNYEFPSIELLSKEESSTDDNIQAEIQENADRLIETLSSFNVTASIKGVDRGPRITRYEVVPAKGVKVSSILNLQDDIALNLAAGAIRMEAPIPGKSAVGIEIPNKTSSIVRLRDLIETVDFQTSKAKTAVCIGRDVAGQPVFGDIAKMPHLLIAGATGMGKSVCINSLMISMLFKARPDEVKFIMIDPKQVEFTMYNGIPHLLVPVVTDPKQAAGSLMWAVEEMERRYNLLYPLCVRNIDAYNEKVAADPSLGEFLPRIVIVIDEFADLMLQVKDPVENLVMRIAQKARAAGIYLIIGTQRPSVNVITGVIKANVPSRISCKVMSNVDSKTVLDSAGAEKLLDRGDMLYAPAGALKPGRVQGAFVADSEVEAIMDHLKKFSDGSTYDSSVMEEIERAAQKCSKKGSGGGSSDYDDDEPTHGEGFMNDRQFLDAVEVAVNTRKISTSLIQRKLSIGYGKAAKFIDIMEEKGIVGESNGQRPREVLVTPEEWREMLARITIDD